MNDITDITKKDFFKLFKNGVSRVNYFTDKEEIVSYIYHGQLEEIEFLKKLYSLEKMPGKYDGYKNALEDIVI